jgi:hypothetical protein
MTDPDDRPETLGEALPREQARVRELIGVYRELPGGVGTFGALMMEDALRRADQAVMSGDVVQMLRSYEELKECE